MPTGRVPPPSLRLHGFQEVVWLRRALRASLWEQPWLRYEPWSSLASLVPHLIKLPAPSVCRASAALHSLVNFLTGSPAFSLNACPTLASCQALPWLWPWWQRILWVLSNGGIWGADICWFQSVVTCLSPVSQVDYQFYFLGGRADQCLLPLSPDVFYWAHGQ